MKGIEIISLIATIVIIIAAVPKNQLFFRIVNGIGSSLLITYGSLLVVDTGYTGYSTIILNSLCLGLSIYHIIRIQHDKNNSQKN